MTSKNRRRRYIRWRMGGIMRENRKVVQTGEDSVNFYRCSWFLTFDRPFLKRLYNTRETVNDARQNGSASSRSRNACSPPTPIIRAIAASYISMSTDEAHGQISNTLIEPPDSLNAPPHLSTPQELPAETPA